MDLPKTKKGANKITLLALAAVVLVGFVLRFVALDKVPVSMFGDELDVGYQAYSIGTTGRDYYGNTLPLHLHSMAEWRTPLYLYSAVPTVALFGITPLGVRLPAAIFGLLTIPALYFLAKAIVESVSGSKIHLNANGVALVAALVLALSPWHIQYSRAGFEVTQLLLFLIVGIYLFLKSLKTGRYLWLSLALLVVTPLIYSTAKLFVPFLLVLMFGVYNRELLSLPKKKIVIALIAALIVGAPTVYSTFFGGGTQRFDYISVFSDPTIEPEVGNGRLTDAKVRGEVGDGLTPSLVDKLNHNKVLFWIPKVVANYLTAYSFDFLFVNGDPSPRHTIEGMGLFYTIEILPLLVGLVLFLVSPIDRKKKFVVLGWLLLAPIPASITRDGGNHATRLILMLPSLVFLIAFGAVQGLTKVGKSYRKLVIVAFAGVLALSFYFYQHNYWIHNPWYSERWWHAGYSEAFGYLKQVDSHYDKVIISMAGEPAWIFFAGYYQYPAWVWQQNFPTTNKKVLPGFGEVSYIDKYYFGSVNVEGGIYSLSKLIDRKTLYLAVAKEVDGNLIKEPNKTPEGLVLLKAVAYPSGEPAYYIFSKL